MFGLRKTKIVVTPDYTVFNIPKVRNVKVAIHDDGDYITLVGYDKRGGWYRLGDREDLIPKQLKDFELTSCRDVNKFEQEKFINKVLNAFG